MPKLNDLTGKRFGRLIVIERAPNRNNKVFWKCQCNCGNICEIRSDQLTRGIATSCGCYAKEITKQLGHNNFKDLTNQRFGKLVAKQPIKNKENSKYYWLCECDCGNIIEVLGTSLTSGNTRSCGCIKSIGEINIKFLLDQNNINYEKEFLIKINNKKYYFDFMILKNNQLSYIIEFDGPQHYGRLSGWFTEERWKQLQINDTIKNQWCKDNNIPLIRIPYFKRDNLCIEDLLLETSQFIVK